MRTATTALTLALASLMLAAPASAETHVACPLADAERTISNPLPPGWWTTPIVEPLTETAIANIGGQSTLVCKYGNAGQIQMRQPSGQVCRTAAGGFDCGGARTGRLHSTGAFLAQQTFLFDLDIGALALANHGADVWFEAVTNSEMYLTPENGTQLALGDGTDRGFAGCERASYSTGRIPVTAAVGRHVCAITSDGRVSQFRVANLSGSTPRSLEIHYTTWN